MLKRLFRDRPAAAGEAYGAPGAGSAPWMSVLSVALIFGGWFIVTFPVWDNGVEKNAAEVMRAADEMVAAADSAPSEQAEEMGYIRGHAEELRDGAGEVLEIHAEMLSANNDAVGEGLDSLARLAGDLSGAARRAGEDAGRLEGGFVAGIQAAAQKADGAARKIQATTTDIRDIARREEADFVLTVPLIKPLFVPSPQKVAGTFFNLLSEEFSGGTLWRHTWDSVRRVFLGFLLAILLAVPIGVLMGINRHMRGFWDPPIEFYRPIPPLAYLPLMIVWFGIGEEPKVLLIFLAIFAPVVINSRAGVRSVAIEQIHAAYSMGATKTQVIWHVILKGAMPEILTGMRIGVAFGWTTLVAAELAAAQAGLGAMIKSASDFLVTDVIFVGIFVIAAIAYFFDLAMRWIDRLAVPWKGKI